MSTLTGARVGEGGEGGINTLGSDIIKYGNWSFLSLLLIHILATRLVLYPEIIGGTER